LKNIDQRVGVFIDVGNMYHSAKSLYNSKVNFYEIVKTAVAGRKLIRAIAYAVSAQISEESAFFDALKKSGIEVKLKDLQTFISGVKKGNWDVGMAVDIIMMAPKLDTVVLVSGDGDFKELLHYVKAQGCRVEVISFEKSTAAKLVEETDDFIDLSKNLNRYIIKTAKTKK
jgi:uncharacterized LabA/DUF88 family protein